MQLTNQDRREYATFAQSKYCGHTLKSQG